MLISLRPHASTPGSRTAIQFDFGFAHGVTYRRELQLRYLVMGRDFPPLGSRRGYFSDNLWQHTCFELFVAASPVATREQPYREFNFSLQGDWAAYSFAAYRDGMTPLNELPPPQTNLRHTTMGLEFEVSLDATAWLPGPISSCRLGPAAVIEDDSGALSYWAAHHPAAKADFHDPRGFVVEWPPASAHPEPKR